MQNSTCALYLLQEGEKNLERPAEGRFTCTTAPLSLLTTCSRPVNSSRKWNSVIAIESGDELAAPPPLEPPTSPMPPSPSLLPPPVSG